MEFMTLSEVRASATEIRDGFEALMRKPSLAPKKNSKQWLFFRRCLEQTLSTASRKLPDYPPQAIAQYKYEVEDKLRNLYNSMGAPLPFIFKLFSHRDAHNAGLIVDDDYPEAHGYHLLIRDRRNADPNDPLHGVSLRDRLEKVITAWVDARFDAYMALPAIDEANLTKFLLHNAPAYLEVLRKVCKTHPIEC